MPLQLTPAGLEIKDEQEIRESLVARVKSKLGSGARTEPGSAIGDWIDVIKLELLRLNEGMAEIDVAFDRRFAEGTSLDELGLLTGVPREPATRSTVAANVTGTNGTPIPALSRVRIPDGSFWRLTEAVVIGVGATPVILESVEIGAIEADTGNITEIVDTVSGWDTVINTEDATTGRTIESDDQYRISMRNGLRGVSRRGTDEGIRQAILESDANIISVTVKSNRDQDPVDSEGTPIHNFRAVVYPDTVSREAIALAIWEAQPSGIRSWGGELENVTDSQGFTQPIRFDWATEIPMYVEVDLTIDSTRYPSDGEDQIKQAVEDFGSLLDVGADVYPARILCAVLEVGGVFSAVVRVGPAPAPTNTLPIEIAFDEIATFDGANVAVTVL